MNELSKTTPAFNGIFNEKFRQAFRAHRLSLGISLQLLAEFLNLHWSTIRKWEAGVTVSCHPRHIVKISKFLSGAYDLQLKVLLEHEIEYAIANRLLPRSRRSNLMNSIPPSLVKELLANLIATVNGTVEHWYLENCRHDK